MKKARYISMAAAGFIVVASIARADSGTFTPAPDDDPNVRYDPDGVPLTITQKQPEKPTADQIAEARKEREQAQLNKDWLLRAYEKQLQAHAAQNPTDDQSANPYQELAKNKDLAKLAGLTDYQADSADDKPLYRTNDSRTYRNDARLRPDAPLSQFSAPFGSAFLKPLVVPLGGSELAGTKSFYATLPDAAFAPFNGSTPAPEPPPTRKSVVPDPIDNDIETPGMIAAKNTPDGDQALTDSTLDVLPGESLAHARAHQDNSEALLQLPIVMDADQLHRAQEAALKPAIAKSADPNQKAATTPAVPTKPIDDDAEKPVQATEMPVINPVRAPIANPFDILNR